MQLKMTDDEIKLASQHLIVKHISAVRFIFESLSGAARTWPSIVQYRRTTDQQINREMAIFVGMDGFRQMFNQT
jgi:hypothetical protein